MNYPKKIAITAFLVALTLLALIYLLATNLLGSIDSTRKEIAGIQYVKPVLGLLGLVEHVQQHRGLVSGYLSGDTSLENHVLAEEARIEEVIKSIDAVDKKFGETLHLSGQWKAVAARWQTLKSVALHLSYQESFARHTALIAELLELIDNIADNSSLFLDPNMGSKHLVDATVSRIPHLIEYLGQMRAKGTTILVRKSITGDEKIRLIILKAQASDFLVAVKHDMASAIREHPGLGPKLGNLSQDVATATASVFALIDTEILASKFMLAPDEFFSMISEPIHDSFKLNTLAITVLEGDLESRESRLLRYLHLSSGIALLGAGLLLLLFAWSYKSIQNWIRLLESKSLELVQANENLTEDIANRMEVEKKLAASETRSRAIVDNAADAIITIDETGLIESFNQAASDIFGYRQEEVMGRNVSMLMPEPHRSAHDGYLANYLAGGEKKIMGRCVETVATRKDGKVFPVDLTVSELKLPDKRLFTGIVRDISERKHAALMEQRNRELQDEMKERLLMEMQLEQALAQQQQVNQLKSRFVSMVSHEYRTPLSVISSSAELIEKHRERMPEEKLKTHFQRIQDSIKRMIELINDTLTIGRYSDGRVEFFPEPLDLEAYCRELADALQLQTNTAHVIRLQCSGDLTHAEMDKKLLQQILANLLTNAVKYSPKADRVEFGIYRENGTAIFEVRDFGIGIPPEKFEHLFEPFNRGANAGTIQGTGLGLAILKNALDLHHGKIEVTSEIGKGTTFRVALPLISGINPVCGAAPGNQ